MNLTELFKTTKLLKLIVILSLIAVLAIIITVTALYKIALRQESQLLTENLNNQIRLMHTMQQLEQKPAGQGKNAGNKLIHDTIHNMQQMNQQANETGHHIEFVVAKRNADQIVFLLWGKKTNQNHSHFTVPFKAGVAEPMRRALSGESGTYIGPDHTGKKILAVYQYIPEYKLGIVEKIYLDNILKPYLLVTLFASIIAIIFVFIGAYSFIVSVRSFYKKDEIRTKQLRKQHRIMSRLVENTNIGPCDIQMIFEAITEASCEGLNIPRASIWLFDTDCNHLHCADLFDLDANSHNISETLSITDYPVYFKTLLEERIINSDNVYTDYRMLELNNTYLKPNGITARLDTTIQLNNKFIGIVSHEYKDAKRDWNQEDRNFAHSIADYIAMAISNCRRNKAEQYLKESEERYELAVAGSSDILWDWNIASNKVYRSPQYTKLLGYENNELRDDFDSWFTHIHPDDKQATRNALNAHLKSADTAYDVEYRIQRKLGDYRWVRARGIALRDENGKPYRVSGSITDITELKQIQNNLSHFKKTLDEIAEYIFMFNPETLIFFYANTSAINSLGYTEAELMQLTLPDISPEYNEKTFRELVSTLITKPEESLNLESIQQHKNGEIIPVEIHLQYMAPDNTPPRFVAIVRNISARKNAEIENYIQRTMLEQIYAVQEGFISGEDRQKVFEQLLNGILDTTESEFGLIGEVIYTDDAPPCIRCRQITNIAWNTEIQQKYKQLTSAGLEFRNLDNLPGSVVTTAKTVISNDPANDPGTSDLPECYPALESFAGLPLKLGEKLIGIVGIANRNTGYDDKVIRQLQPLLSTCTTLLEAENVEAIRNAMENALRHSEEKANTVLATVADGIITIDDKGTVESYNRAAEQIFGFSAKEVIGNNITMLMPEPYHSAHDGYLQSYQQTGEAHIVGTSREVQGKRKDGSIFPMDLSVGEMHSGIECKYTGVVRDITDRKQAETALIAARDEAEKANRTKSEFLSSMSHELRTPLNAIMGFAQLLQLDSDLSDTQKKQVNTIYSAGGLLLDLVNDVLDLAKIEVGHIELSIDSIELVPALKDSFRLISSLARKKGIKLSFENDVAKINCCKNVWVHADNTRLRQVLLNLLSNAIKYNTENGSVYICCPPPPPGFHRISIIDSGHGISEQNIKNLFQPFNRLGAQNGDIEGTGIGLVITRKLVELMGGAISVESELGKGSSFIIDLPVADAVVTINNRPKTQTKKPPVVGDKQYRILVAEDNLTNQELITLQLDTLGYISDVVSNGKEAWDRLQKQNYDLLLTDIHMPEMDGYQLTESMRNCRDCRFRNITIIAITANAVAAETTHCIEKGMNDCLSKPVNINELQRKLHQWLTPVKDTVAGTKPETDTNQSTTAETGAAKTRSSIIVSPETEAIDTDVLTRYIGSDPKKHRRFFRLFLDTAPATVMAIHQAHKNHSCSDIRGACHKIKSSSYSIGAVRLSTLCQHIETAATEKDWTRIDKTLPEIDAAMSEVESYYCTQLAEEDPPQLQFSFDDVLIIDDDRFVLDLVTLRLNSLGINKIKTASSGENALAYIKNTFTPPSVLLLDLNMPGMDGVEFLRHLSKQAYSGNIILISAEDTRLLHSAENIARDRKLNILGTLEKPVTLAPLTELLLLAGTDQTTRPLRDRIYLTKSELRHGIDNDEFVMYYQPQIDIASKQLSGVEALIRWVHPEHGLIAPDAFIPLAEKFKLINDMTDIILHKTMAQCVRWHKQGLDINLSINISVDSLNRLDLPEYIVDCAQQHHLDVSRLMLEITESRLMQDITSALDVLTRLSLKGIGLSIDDFGTGYSSMEQLQRIPFRELKIDRAFVSGALHDRAARVILESSVELAQKLNMTVVAEGVENKDCLELAATLDCTVAQGYYIAKPMPAEKIMGWYEEWKIKPGD